MQAKELKNLVVIGGRTQGFVAIRKEAGTDVLNLQYFDCVGSARAVSNWFGHHDFVHSQKPQFSRSPTGFFVSENKFERTSVNQNVFNLNLERHFLKTYQCLQKLHFVLFFLFLDGFP